MRQLLYLPNNVIKRLWAYEDSNIGDDGQDWTNSLFQTFNFRKDYAKQISYFQLLMYREHWQN